MNLLKIVLVTCCLAFGYAKPTQLNTNSLDDHVISNFTDFIGDMCTSMVVGNNSSEPQSTIPPYSVTTSKTSLKSGEELLVTIEGDTNSDKIYEFFIDGRPTDGLDIAYGKFIVPTYELHGLRAISCFQRPNNVVIFKRYHDPLSTSITFPWQAPNVAQITEYNFVVTIYKARKTYWTNVVSNKVTVNPK